MEGHAVPGLFATLCDGSAQRERTQGTSLTSASQPVQLRLPPANSAATGCPPQLSAHLELLGWILGPDIPRAASP